MINLNCLLVLPSWSLSSARLRNHGHCCRPTAAEIALTSAHSWHPPVPPQPRPQLQHDGDLQDQAPPHPHSVSQVASERNDREQFLRSGVNPGYGGVRQNGTYSSHPNLPTFDPLTHPSQLSAFPPIEPPALPKMAPLPRPPVRQPAKKPIVPLVLQVAQGGSHRKLPALPKQPSSLKLQTWRQVGQETLKCLSEVFLLPELAAGETEPARAGFRRFKREPHGEHDHHFRHCSDHQGHRDC